MNEQTNDKGSDDQQASADDKVDQGRRRLGTASVTGTAVLLSLPSRSAVAGWGSCTGSELASGNLSRAATANPCGCSPGFWGPANLNGTALWNKTPKLYTKYPRTAKFNTVFGVTFFKNTANITLEQVFPQQKAGPGKGYFNNFNASDSTAMHAVAALLNAEFYGLRFPAGYADGLAAIAAFRAACTGGTLTTFVTHVDVYSSSNTWCNGKDHGGI
ncbi:hypothetical protein [Roseateles oligotrophus]|uniref:Uncharacterized protein n=1 Tax=Roseateles oligotrophus TaxID=1769250 RepID=A0ABT2YDD3_9BURK|nr:hypothetical protein [Roseateles oligotrophus]MCV2368005.1 hypothetical protein [Roseateles oligotrophus]